MTAKTRILNSLKKGNLTTKQAQSRFGIVNVSARVAELRDDGYAIRTNLRVTNGQRKYSYSLNG